MDLSTIIQGAHATASPSGQYLALISNGKLRICAAHAPERCTEVNIRIQAKDVTSLRWNNVGDRIAVVSARTIEVLQLDDASRRVRLDNGSAGLGRFVSADFVAKEQLLVIWEFGKAKVWDLSTGRGAEINDVKTGCSGKRWGVRPGDGADPKRTLATLSRPGADDSLNIYFPVLHKQFAAVKIPTVDAQSLYWSPNGRWLAVLDSPTANQSIHFFTPDGHHFRAFPSESPTNTGSLGIKSVAWSPNSQMIALTRYDGRIVLLNTRTFTPLAIIEHTTTIDQRASSQDQQAPIWQEAVSASSARSYTNVPQPVSVPVSKAKPTTEPSELGVIEARFSCDGSFLATRDERMLNTVWIWDMSTLGAHAVIIQHSNVRRLQWHPARGDTLLIDCAEGIAYLFQALSSLPPTPLRTSTPSYATLSWLNTTSSSVSTIVTSTKSSSRLLWPEGQPHGDDSAQNGAQAEESEDQTFDEGASEDSLFDVLSGRKPLPPKTEQSYTEKIDMEVETEEDDTNTGIDDTFREKRKSRRPVEVDPFDDSQIF